MLNYSQQFLRIQELCKDGSPSSIDSLMEILHNSDLPVSRAVDFYMGLIDWKQAYSR